jgi:benzoylformate decarboxylase
LAERIGAPVFLEAMADRASFPSSHPLFAGAIPRLSPAVRRTLGPHDLIVSIGGDLFTQSLATGLDVLEPGRAIVHLDVDPWEIGKNHAVGAAILGDPKASLPDLLAAIDRRMDDDARGRAQERRVSSERQLAVSRAEVVARAVTIRPGEPLRAINLLAALGSDLPADTIIIEELLSSNPGIRDLIRCDLPDSFFGLRGGGIGMAAPQAVGAKIAKPDRPVVALIGDGSALYSIQVLWTAAHERLAVVFIIFNNRSYHILKQRTRALGGHSAQTLRFVAMDLDDPPIDFVGLATSLGVPATRVATLDDFRNALAAALAAKTPRLIDVTIQSEL